VGTELLLGQIVDTNSSWIADALAEAGIDSHIQIKVGDNVARIVDALRVALARSDAVIVCGGLGPTQDDVTRQALAEVLGVPLELDEEQAARIAQMFASAGRQMPKNNLRQAEVPRGAEVIPQTRGTAPGLMASLGDRRLYAVPGVPHEMRDMVSRAVIPDLVARAGPRQVIKSRTLRTWGVSESALAETLAGRMAQLDQQAAAGQVAPTIAFLASGIEGIKVRITVKADSEEQAWDLIGAEEAEVRALLGAAVFGVDDQTMEQVVGDLLVGRGLCLALAESLTGGLVASRVTAVAGASRWFRGSLVVYSSDTKRSLLGVSPGPVVSEGAALEMAEGVRKVLGADVGLSLTGVAGPDLQEGQPVGTVWVGLSGLGESQAHLLRLARLAGGGREQIRQIATISALDLVRRRLLEPWPPPAPR